MKALPMLDHVMLWVARGFIVFLLIVMCFDIWALAGANLVPPLGLLMLEYIAEVAFLTASFLMLRNNVGRLCLGGAAALGFVRGAFDASRRLMELPNVIPSHIFHFLAVTFLMHGISLIGLASLIWISIRPPQSSKTSDPDSPHNYPLPQSS
jgi:hypothetical protein